MRKQGAGFRTALYAAVLGLGIATQAHAAVPVFQKTTEGLIRPFKIIDGTLSDFTRGYANLTGTHIEVGGRWEDELRGRVVLFIPRPIPLETLTELFHQVLLEKGFAVVDAPGKTGWIIQRNRDARDGALPLYDSSQVPGTYRLVTVVHHLKHRNAEEIVRTARSFMPSNSRIIPATKSQIGITDTAKNIRNILKIIEMLDTEESKLSSSAKNKNETSAEACEQREMKIDKLTVERLEIRDMESGDLPGPVATHAKVKKAGGKK